MNHVRALPVRRDASSFTITAPVLSIAKVAPNTATGRTLKRLGKNFDGTPVTFQGVPGLGELTVKHRPEQGQDQPDGDDAERHRDLKVGHHQGPSQPPGALDTCSQRQPAGRAGSYALPARPDGSYGFATARKAS